MNNPYKLLHFVNVFSLLCMVLTITVYLYVNKLRNQLGKCLVLFLFCSVATNIIFYLHFWELIPFGGICQAAGYTCYFFGMAAELWGTAFTHNVWNGLKSVNRSDPGNRFLAYNIFAWGTAASLAGVLFLLDYFFVESQYYNLLPRIGVYNCCLNDFGTIYIIAPLSVMDAYRVIVFILSAFHIAKVKRDLRKFIQNDESRIRQKSGKNNFLMLLRLFSIMALSWSLNILSRLTEGDVHKAVEVVTVYFHSSTGIIIFALFILKRSTLRLLMESISCMRKGQDANNAQTA